MAILRLRGSDGRVIAIPAIKGDAFTYEDFTAEQLAALTGPMGPKGDKGDTGQQGIQGIQGLPGLNGYSPVRGVDYWTDADQEQIIADVLDELPAASTMQAGIVTLSDSVSSSGSTQAATSKAVKAAYDEAEGAYDRADDAYELASGVSARVDRSTSNASAGISYTKSNTTYAFPNDGYLFVGADSTFTGTLGVVVLTSNDVTLCYVYMSNLSGINYQSLYVKKGMKIKIASMPTGCIVKFMPLV